MDEYTVSEQAFANGYSAGYEAGRRSVGLVKWVPVSKKMPEPCVNVLICRDGKIMVGYYEDGEWFSYECVGKRVTHWMPLPELPKGE